MMDTHCHLFTSDYDNLDSLLNNIKNEEIKLLPQIQSKFLLLTHE